MTKDSPMVQSLKEIAKAQAGGEAALIRAIQGYAAAVTNPGAVAAAARLDHLRTQAFAQGLTREFFDDILAEVNDKARSSLTWGTVDQRLDEITRRIRLELERKAMIDAKAGTMPNETIDPLELVASFAGRMASDIGTKCEKEGYYKPDTLDLALLSRARRLLILNAYHVPPIVDAILDRHGEP